MGISKLGKTLLNIATGGLTLPLLGGGSAFEKIYSSGASTPGGAVFKKYFGSGADDFTEKEAAYAKEAHETGFAREGEWRAQDLQMYNEHRNQDREREEQWRMEDIEREERWREEDIQRNSIQHKMQELKNAGLHTALAGGGTLGASSMGSPTMTRSGGRAAMPNSGGSSRYSPTRSGTSSNPVEMAQMISQISLDRGNIQVMNAEAQKMREEAEYIKAQRQDLTIKSMFTEEFMTESINKLKEEQSSMKTDSAFTEEQMRELTYDLQKSIEMGIRTGQTNPVGMAVEATSSAAQEAINNNTTNEEERKKLYEIIGSWAAKTATKIWEGLKGLGR